MPRPFCRLPFIGAPTLFLPHLARLFPVPQGRIDNRPQFQLRIQGALLFFTKGEPTKEIWYYEHPYPPGVKHHNQTNPIRIEEFEAERKWWGNLGQEKKRKENEFSWRVSLADIAARGYNLDVKNPHTVDAAHRDPVSSRRSPPRGDLR